MERYRLLPHEAGIAISVPHVYRNLIAQITREVPLITHLEKQEGRLFQGEGERWGIGDGLRVEEKEEQTMYIAEFFEGSNHRLTSRSIHLLIIALTPIELLDPDPEAPLIHLKGLLAQDGISGYDIGVELSPRMIELLARFTDEHRRRVEDTMRATSLSMGVRQDYPFTCSTRLVLSLVVPGEETWLACAYAPAQGSYAEMGGHNIDHAQQQFALLAGLAEAQTIAEEIGAS